MEESRRLLLHPLLSSSAAAAVAAQPLDDGEEVNLKLISSNSSIISRLFLVAFIAVVSVWANHEASKGYAISVVNDSSNAFLAARFDLFYVSNDGATRAAIKASNSIENFLFPASGADYSTKKPIESVVIRLIDRDLTENVAVGVGIGGDRGRFELSISSRALENADFGREMALAIRRGVARVWLWDGEGHAPANLVNGIVEFLVDYSENDSSIESESESESELESAAAWWNSTDPRSVAALLRRAERRRAGFVGRLNSAMKDGWSDDKLGGAWASLAISESLRYNSSSA